MNNMVKIEQPLISIIMPAFNCENFIGKAIESVENQSYQNWELIIVDDCSTDTTGKIVSDYMQFNKKIRYQCLSKNSGTAIARNTAIELSVGDYIAFLDSDDLWMPSKLLNQLTYMLNHKSLFSCTSYSKIDEHGNKLNRVIRAKKKSDYMGVLKNCPGNSTVMYNAKKLGKFYIPNIRKRNDYVMWLQIIKKAKYLDGIAEQLSSHRIVSGSISSNKFSLVKYHWTVYREIEDLSFFYSTYLIAYWSVKTILNYYRRNA